MHGKQTFDENRLVVGRLNPLSDLKRKRMHRGESRGGHLHTISHYHTGDNIAHPLGKIFELCFSTMERVNERRAMGLRKLLDDIFPKLSFSLCETPLLWGEIVSEINPGGALAISCHLCDPV